MLKKKIEEEAAKYKHINVK
nr:C5a=14 kda anaphylatoxin {N-terminal} [sheep, zymosan-activated plasma, Peptide Partial, 19 aa] [Ovis aries]